MYIPSFVTLEELRELSLDTKKVADDNQLKRFCLEASREIEVLANGRQFAPYFAVFHFDYPYDVYRLELGFRDLLEVTELATENGELIIPATDYLLKSGSDYDITPYNFIENRTDRGVVNFQWGGTLQQSQRVTGWWGHVLNWPDAMRLTDGTVTSVSGRTVTVNGNVDALDLLDGSPQYPILSTIRIDNELMLVVGRNSNTNTLTVERGINGTTAASHTVGAEIYRFIPDETIRRVSRILADWYYKRRSQSRDPDRPIMTNQGVVLPANLPREVTETMRQFRYAGLY